MILYSVENIKGKNYFFKSKGEMRNYFVTDGEQLLVAMDTYKRFEINEYKINDILNDPNNFILGINLESEQNLREVFNFNYLRESLNFQNVLDEFISNTELKESNIDDTAIYALKKKLLRKSTTIHSLLKSLEVHNSILKYFLIKAIRKFK